MIFPELKGKLNGHAVRVPLLNGSLTDAVIELKQSVTVEQVNAAFKAAAEGLLEGILGYEERPLVSCDYTNDNRSSIVDALSTMVVDGNQLKVFAWYDNEWGYSCRMADLTCHVVGLDAGRFRLCSSTASSPPITGPSRSPMGPCGCWWCSTSINSATPP